MVNKKKNSACILSTMPDGVILNMLNQRENSLYQAKYEVFRQ